MRLVFIIVSCPFLNEGNNNNLTESEAVARYRVNGVNARG